LVLEPITVAVTQIFELLRNNRAERLADRRN
jgi:hypothetical protein